MTDTPVDMAAKLEAWADGIAEHPTPSWFDEQIDTLRAAASLLRDMSEREKALREALHEIAKCEIEYSDGLAACYGPPVLSAEQMAATAFAALSLNNNARAK